MTNKINSHDAKVLATGIGIGATAAAFLCTYQFGRAFKWLTTKEKLKSDFITWMFTTGMHLPEDEMFKAAQTEWDFINQVTKK